MTTETIAEDTIRPWSTVLASLFKIVCGVAKDPYFSEDEFYGMLNLYCVLRNLIGTNHAGNVERAVLDAWTRVREDYHEFRMRSRKTHAEILKEVAL